MPSDGTQPDDLDAALLLRLRREAQADRDQARVARLEAIRAANSLVQRAQAETGLDVDPRHEAATGAGGLQLGESKADVQQRLERVERELASVERLLRSALADGALPEGRIAR